MTGNAAENPIETLAARLQSLPLPIRWLYSQEDLVYAAALGLPPVRGPWTRRSDRIVAWASHFGLARQLAAAVNLLLLAVALAKQSFVRGPSPAPAAVFVGINTLRDPELAKQFERMQSRPVVVLDERGFVDFFRHGGVPFLDLIYEMRRVWREVWEHLGPSTSTEGLEKVHLLSHLLMRGHKFAYVRAWFRHYLRQPGASPVVAWTSASHLSFAPVAAGAETVYMLHGFQRHSLVFPDFTRSICFSGFEGAHLRRRLPRCEVTIVSEPPEFVATRPVVAVAGIAWEQLGFDRIRPVVEWALQNNLPVVVRKHPRDTSSYWSRWKDVAGLEITDGQGSFPEFLERTRPRFLATWCSTALFDALAMGIVPITVTPEGDETAVDTVFPFRELSLCWPEHEELARSLIDDEKRRNAFLARTYAAAMDVRPEHVDRPEKAFDQAYATLR